MTWFLIILTAAVYGVLMKVVLNNVFVSNRKTLMNHSADTLSGEKDARDLIPAYDR
ncbi:hypothetical protein [Bacillus sp. AK031]